MRVEIDAAAPDGEDVVGHRASAVPPRSPQPHDSRTRIAFFSLTVRGRPPGLAIRSTSSCAARGAELALGQIDRGQPRRERESIHG